MDFHHLYGLTLTKTCRMLYDFHHKQNAKRPGSVHATYLVSGVQAGKSESKGVQKKDEDVHMQSSPFMSSSMPNQDEEEPQSQPEMRVITLTREEHLEGI
jgi:DNA polymerase delta subunit 3